MKALVVPRRQRRRGGSSMPCLSSVMLLLFTCLHTGSARYFFFCDIDGREVVTLRYNTDTNEYEEEREDKSSRRLQQAETLQHHATSLRRINRPDDGTRVYDDTDFDLDDFESAMRVGARRERLVKKEDMEGVNTSGDIQEQTQEQQQPQDTIQAKLCSCAVKSAFPNEKYYCPIGRSHCGVPGSFDSDLIDPGCLTLHSDDIFAQSVWPILIIWYGIALLFCMCTVPGRNAIGCCIQKCWPFWNARVVDLLIQHNPARANAMIRSSWGRTHDSTTDGQTENTIHTATSTFVQVELPSRRRRLTAEYALKTKIYKTPGADKDDENDAIDDDPNVDSHGCSICFAPLLDGDRVGALECQHVFHVHCL